jgi:hypothetical protein
MPILEISLNTYVRSDIFTAVTLKNVVFSEEKKLSASYKNRRFGRKYSRHRLSDKNRRARKCFSIN